LACRQPDEGRDVQELQSRFQETVFVGAERAVSVKTPGIQAILDALAVKMTGSPVTKGKCPVCGGEAVEFRDALSVKENQMSGLCQKCQDEVFFPDNE
jgi:hypothetical protein